MYTFQAPRYFTPAATVNKMYGITKCRATKVQSGGYTNSLMAFGNIRVMGNVFPILIRLISTAPRCTNTNIYNIYNIHVLVVYMWKIQSVKHDGNLRDSELSPVDNLWPASSNRGQSRILLACYLLQIFGVLRARFIYHNLERRMFHD